MIGVTTTLERLELLPPFKPFVHRWERLTKAIDTQDDETTKEHLLLLHRTLKEELKEIIAVKHDYIANGVITYDHLWTIFHPDCNVYTTQGGRDCALKFSEGTYIDSPRHGPCFQLTCHQIDWDGERFGYALQRPLVRGFSGTKPITEVEAFPLDFHPNCGAITEKLLTRGKLFEDYQGYHFKAYQGIAIAQTPCGPVKVNVDSRIIIDRYAYGRFNPNEQVYLKSLTHKSGAGSDYDDNCCYDDNCYYDDGRDDGDLGYDNRSKRVPLTKEQLIICAASVKGYALKSKRWLEFSVDTVSDVQWNHDVFESLVLPEDQKELILAFAESQILYKEKFDDFVSGKGKGIIMLLSGVNLPHNVAQSQAYEPQLTLHRALA